MGGIGNIKLLKTTGEWKSSEILNTSVICHSPMVVYDTSTYIKELYNDKLYNDKTTRDHNDKDKDN